MRRRLSEPRRVVEEEEIAPEQIWSVSASSDYAWPAAWIASPSSVLDPDESTMWNARSFAPAWIRFDLGHAALPIERLELLPSMEPKVGTVEHRIRMGQNASSMDTVAIVGGPCRDREWIHCRFPQPRRARFVEILTTKSPSWVAWIRVRLWTERR